MTEWDVSRFPTYLQESRSYQIPQVCCRWDMAVAVPDKTLVVQGFVHDVEHMFQYICIIRTISMVIHNNTDQGQEVCTSFYKVLQPVSWDKHHGLQPFISGHDLCQQWTRFLKRQGILLTES